MSDSPPTSACELHAVVLAAGAGSRFGGAKLRADYRGKPLIRWAVEAACASPAARITLVTGADPEVAAAARCDGQRPLLVTQAMDWAEGLAASLRAGFSSAPANAAGVFVFLGDMPRTPPGIGDALLEALKDGKAAVAPVFAGKRGHPVLVGPALMPAVATLTGDVGLNGLLEALGGQLALVETDDDGVLFDVDTPEHLQA